jgi:hypothetical protein
LRFKDIIDLWPSQFELWQDLVGRHPKLAYATVRSWRQRDRINGGYFEALLEAAERRGYHSVTPDVINHAAAMSGRTRPLAHPPPVLEAV